MGGNQSDCYEFIISLNQMGPIQYIVVGFLSQHMVHLRGQVAAKIKATSIK